MSLAAVDAIEDALAATKQFLLPVETRQWAKLAVVVLFVGGGGGFNLPGGGGSPGGESDLGGGSGASQLAEGPFGGGMDPAVIGVILALLGLIGLVVLAWLAVSAIMEYVLVESLRTRDVLLGSYWRSHWPAGLGLLAFRLGLLVLALVVFLPVIVMGVAIDPAMGLLAIPLAVLVIPVFVLLNGFTTLFVVPITIVEDCGLIAGWRRLWATMRTAPKETAAFAATFAALSVGIGVLVTIVMAIVLVALAVPFLVLGLIAFVAGGTTLSPTVGAILVILGLIYFVLAIAAMAAIQVPAVVYKRYHALFVLGDLSAQFDLIPGLRGPIRAEETAA